MLPKMKPANVFGLLVGLLSIGVARVSAIKVIVGPGRTECVAETVTAEHFEVDSSLVHVLYFQFLHIIR